MTGLSVVAAVVLFFAAPVASQAQARSWSEPYNRGVRAFDAGNYREAVALLERAVAADPRCAAGKVIEGVFRADYFPYDYLRAAYLLLNQPDQAAQNAERALRCSAPQSLQARLNSAPGERPTPGVARAPEPATPLAVPPSPILPSVLVPASALSQLRGVLQPGDTLWVTDTAGRATRGTLAELSTATLELLTERTGPIGRGALQAQQVSERDIQEIRVERPDPIWDGAFIGLGVGLAWMLACASSVCDDDGRGSENTLRQLGAFTGLAGALVGAVIDGAHRQRITIFRAPEPRASGASRSPLPPTTGLGVEFRLKPDQTANLLRTFGSLIRRD